MCGLEDHHKTSGLCLIGSGGSSQVFVCDQFFFGKVIDRSCDCGTYSALGNENVWGCQDSSFQTISRKSIPRSAIQIVFVLSG